MVTGYFNCQIISYTSEASYGLSKTAHALKVRFRDFQTKCSDFRFCNFHRDFPTKFLFVDLFDEAAVVVFEMSETAVVVSSHIIVVTLPDLERPLLKRI